MNIGLYYCQHAPIQSLVLRASFKKCEKSERIKIYKKVENDRSDEV